MMNIRTMEDTAQSLPNVSVELETAEKIEFISKHTATGIIFDFPPETPLYSFYLTLPEIDRLKDQLTDFLFMEGRFQCFISNSRKDAYFAKESSESETNVVALTPSYEDAQAAKITTQEVLEFFKAEYAGFFACLDISPETPISTQIIHKDDHNNIFRIAHEALDSVLSSVQTSDPLIEKEIRTAWAFYLDQLHRENIENLPLYEACQKAEKDFNAFIVRHRGDAFICTDSYEFSQRDTLYFKAEPTLLDELEGLNLITIKDEDFLNARAGRVSCLASSTSTTTIPLLTSIP